MTNGGHRGLLVQDALYRSAERFPHKTALVCAAERYTYAQLEGMVNRLGHALRAVGLKRGDRVVIHAANSVETVLGIFGTLAASGVFVCVNPSTKRDKLVYIINNCRAKLLLTGGRAAGSSVLGGIARECPSLRGTIACTDDSASPDEGADPRASNLWKLLEAFPDHRPIRESIDLDLACLIYTSGTTGDPKGVMSDHSNVVFAADSIIEYLGNTESDIVLSALPLSFDYGLYQLLMTFRFGGTLVLEPSFAYLAAFLETMARERVTGFPGVPTMFAMLLGMDLASYDLSSLRYLTNTAAALPESHILAVRKLFPHATLYSMYGLTETKRTLYLPPAELDRRPQSVGIPIPGTEAWVEDAEGHRLGPGEIGELVVRGRHVMRGYWEAPEATAERYRPGPTPGERLCYTGDLFRTDAEGFFYFVGRKDDIIKCRGEKVAPREVENVLYQLPGMREAAVIGVADPILGQAIKAFVVVDEGQVTEKQVFAHCRAHLEDYLIPKYVEVRNELPKTSSGKIKKTDLH